MNFRITLVAVLLLGVFAPQMPSGAEDQTSEETRSTSNRWMLLCCGLPGDEEHRIRLTEACQRIIANADETLGITQERFTVLAGDEEMTQALEPSGLDIQVCDRETIEQSISRIASTIPPGDGLWIVLLGHAHLYGGGCQFNIQGPDINQSDFAMWTKAIQCQEQVIWNTLPVSGFWTKPLAKRGRIVVSATEADLEFTGTEMPYALSSVLSGDQEHQVLEDIDGDGTLSLLDLYLATNIEVAMRFRSMDRLQTEHGQLDDNGDGRGSEVQARYLLPEPSDEADDEPSDESVAPRATPEVISSKNQDGYRSRQVILNEESPLTKQ